MKAKMVNESYKIKAPKESLNEFLRIDDESNLSTGEQAAISKGMDVLTTEQLAALYLFAKEMEGRKEDLRGRGDNVLTRNAFKMNADTNIQDFRKLPISRMADVLDIKPRTSNYTISKFRLLLRGEREGTESNIMYPKLVDHFDMFEEMQPAEVLALAQSAINMNADYSRSEEYLEDLSAKEKIRKQKNAELDKKLADNVIRLYKSLYPIYGDRAGIKAISKVSKESGIDEKKLSLLVRTQLKKDIVFANKFKIQ